MNVSPPRPALVTERGARRLPRLALLLLCAAYLLPGLIGRDPWRNADITAYAQMLAIADGRVPWWAPTLGGVASDTALLPHWLGAACIRLFDGWLEPALAARLPFAALLALTLALVWYTTFHLARTEAAQPVAFAFGGEAGPVDYARAIADGAVLALMATLGLLVLGHETTPELVQLAAVALFLYGLACASFRAASARLAVLLALPLLAGSGGPSMAMALGAGGIVVCAGSRSSAVRTLVVWLAVAMAGAAALAAVFGAWRWRGVTMSPADGVDLLRQWLWFLWPCWPMVLLTMWRWRRQWRHRHLSVPAVGIAVPMLASLSMAGSDRVLMLALPGLATLAAFALPTLKRSASAAVDWFSMGFFTLFALWIWFVYAAMQLGWPAWQWANLQRLLPGYEPRFSAVALALAGLGSAAWVTTVRWRTGRHREALWKSMVLPAGGVALCWLLAMTLWLPPLDYARSPRPLMARLAAHIPARGCIWAPGLAPAAVAALESIGHWRVDAGSIAPAECASLLLTSRRSSAVQAPAGWRLQVEVQRPTDRDETTRLFERETPAPAPAAAPAAVVTP